MTQRAAEATEPRIAAVGMFDGVHLGHRMLLEQLRSLGEGAGLRPMAYTFANHPLGLVAPGRAPRLLTTAAEKGALLRGAGVEPVVVPFDQGMRLTSARDFLRRLRDHYGVRRVLLGFNNRFGHDAPPDTAAYEALGRSEGVEIARAGEYTIAGLGHDVSSSSVRRALEEGRPEEAAAMLGRPYALTGEVVHGRALGRQLGFPTANIAVPDEKLVPADGVYAAEALTSGDRAYPALVNIGHRPTVDRPDAPRSIEAHLIGLEPGADLYGRPLTLLLRRYLRPERRFATPGELAAAIAADLEAVRRGTPDEHL